MAGYGLPAEQHLSVILEEQLQAKGYKIQIINGSVSGNALSEADFKRILKEPDNSLIKQYVALLKTENVDLEFTEDGIDLIAKVSAEVNASVENIGARRLHTLLEKILDDISFTAPDRSGEKIIIDKKYIENNLGELAKDMDLSKFIL